MLLGDVNVAHFQYLELSGTVKLRAKLNLVLD